MNLPVAKCGLDHPAYPVHPGSLDQVVVFFTDVLGWEEIVGRNDVSAFALDGFDQDARDVFARHQATNHLFLDVIDHGLPVTHAVFAHQHRAIRVGEGHVQDAVHEREEAAFIVGFAGSKSDRAERAPVESAQESDKLRCFGVKARQFDSAFDTFGAGVGHKGKGFFLPGSVFG